jgi:hypothetical protein
VSIAFGTLFATTLFTQLFYIVIIALGVALFYFISWRRRQFEKKMLDDSYHLFHELDSPAQRRLKQLEAEHKKHDDLPQLYSVE